MTKIGLDKKQKETHQELASRLRGKHGDVCVAVRNFNEAMAKAWIEMVEPAVLNFNELVLEANEFRESAREEAQGEFDDKTEKWQEGDNGQAAGSWISEWENEVEELGLDAPDEAYEPSEETIESFDNLPVEPG